MAFGKVLGIITEVLPIEKGVKKNGGGEWMRQTFVVKKIEESDYEHFVALTCSGEQINRINPQVGQVGFFLYDVESNKSNEGRWFTNAVCKRFDAVNVTPNNAENAAERTNAPQAEQYTAAQDSAAQVATQGAQAGGNNDLPF